MPKFIEITARAHGTPPVPFLVRDPRALSRIVGVRAIPCAKPPKAGEDHCGCAHAAAHYAPAVMIVQHDAHFDKEAKAETIMIGRSVEADTLAAARAMLAKEKV